jgi:hypothetical protein
MPPPGKFSVTGTTGDVLTIAAPTAPSFIRIFSLQLTVTATSTVTFKSGSTEIGRAYLGTGNDYTRTNEHSGILDCEPGESFTIGNSAGTIGGDGSYTIVPGATGG